MCPLDLHPLDAPNQGIDIPQGAALKPGQLDLKPLDLQPASQAPVSNQTTYGPNPPVMGPPEPPPPSSPADWVRSGPVGPELFFDGKWNRGVLRGLPEGARGPVGMILNTLAGMKGNTSRDAGDAITTQMTDAAVPIAAGAAASGLTGMIPGVGEAVAPYAGALAAGAAAKFNPDIENAVHKLYGVDKHEDRSGLTDAALTAAAGLGLVGASRFAANRAALAEETALAAKASENANPPPPPGSPPGGIQGASEATGVPLRPDELDPANVQAMQNYQKAAQKNPQAALSIQEDRVNQVIQKAKNLPGMNEARAASESGNYSHRDWLDLLQEAKTENISAHNKMAVELGGERQMDATPLLVKSKALLPTNAVYGKDGRVIVATLPQRLQDVGKFYNGLLDNTTRAVSPDGLGIYQNGIPNEMTGGQSPYMPPGSGDQFGRGLSRQARSINGSMVSPAANVEGVYRPPAPREGAYDQNTNYPGGSYVDPSKQARGLMPTNDAGPATAGISLKKLNGLLSEAEQEANFRAKEPTPGQQAFREIYGQASDLRDDFSAKIFEDAGKPELARQLRASRSDYAETIDQLKQQRALIDQDPTNAAKLLLNPAKPQLAKDVMAMASPEQRQVLKGQFLDQIVAPQIEDQPGMRYFGARAVGKQWAQAKAEPKFIQAVFSDPREVQAIDNLISVGKAIENRMVSIGAQPDQGMVDRAKSIVLSPRHGFINFTANLIDSIFDRTPNLAQQLKMGMMQKFGGQSAAELALKAQKWRGASNAFTQLPGVGRFLGQPTTDLPANFFQNSTPKPFGQ